MKSIGTGKGRTVPEEVKVVNETNVVDSAGGLRPGFKTKDSGEKSSFKAESWELSAEPDTLSTAI